MLQWDAARILQQDEFCELRHFSVCWHILWFYCCLFDLDCWLFVGDTNAFFLIACWPVTSHSHQTGTSIMNSHLMLLRVCSPVSYFSEKDKHNRLVWPVISWVALRSKSGCEWWQGVPIWSTHDLQSQCSHHAVSRFSCWFAVESGRFSFCIRKNCIWNTWLYL